MSKTISVLTGTVLSLVRGLRAGAEETGMDPMADSVSGLTTRRVELGGAVVRAARELAAAENTTAERLLATACAALAFRLGRVDSDLLTRGLRAAGGDCAPVKAELLPDGTAVVTADDVGPWFVERAGDFVARALARPDTPLARIEVVDDAEWARLTAWAGRALDYPGEPVHRLFARRAEEQPDAVALSTGAATVTYRDLHERAAGIAGALHGRGVRAGDRVGVLLERGADAVAALAGVAMAGATAVPLDPAYPRPRLHLMLSRAGAGLTVTDRACGDRADVGPVLLVEETAPAPRAPEVPVGLSDVAAVMYTSGSTGTPKGVELTHRGIARLVHEDEHIDFGPDDVALHLAPATFDASLLEIWGALARGARLEIAAPGPLTLGELAAVIRERGVTVLWLTAGLFHQMAEHEPECFAGVRRLLTGGDVVSPHHVRALLARHPGLTVVNGYGPTENTTFTCCHLVREPLPAGTASVPIGRPIANTRVYLVDRVGQPVPAGVPGELWAAGDGLARGYLDQPELTADRFPAPADGRLRGVRCYRTGDLAMWRPDGTLEFLGREDAQAKVNGHRIEPGEVEQAILAHPGVRGVCVVVETDPLGGKRLAAHIAGDGAALARSVRAHLLASLPPYLVPARWVVVDQLPLTANGKVDRDRLRAGESESS
jgi:amino acid adenylation domain-containing protein